jgi:arylsulfatase A-like enzyme
MAVAPFEGVIGRTVQESVAAWEPYEVPPEGTPNVVVVLLDDSGFSHFGCYGSSIETPNVDRLAANGLRYTNFHVTPVCSPTRASLLTGRNHHSVGMRSVADFDTGFPNMRGAIPRNAATLAEMLQPRGFATFMVGKWHLTPAPECSPAGPFHNRPLARGFDRYYGFLGGETDQFRPELVVGNEHVDPPRLPSEGYHLSEDLVDRAARFLRDHTSITPERPFFLYTAFGATHAPHHAPLEYRLKYRGKFDHGWDVERERVFARQQAMSIVPEGTELPARNPGVVAWTELSEPEQRFAARLQEAYAAFLDHTDAQIGRLVDTLAELGVLENTLVMVLSDNGASQEGGARGVLDEMKFLQGIEQDIDEAIEHLDDIGGPASHPNYPWGWAMVGNTPLRRYKQNTHGGGVRSPLVVHGPAGLGARGEMRSQFSHVIDLVPTVLDVVSVDAPDEVAGVAQQPIHGRSMRATFADPDAPEPRDTQYFEMFGHRAIYHRGWKAVTYHPPGHVITDDDWELFHLDDDYSEVHDLSDDQPDKRQEMIDRFWAEAGRFEVLPLDGRALTELFLHRPFRRGTPTSRTRYVYRPPVSHLPVNATPPTGLGAFSISVDIEVPDGGAGVGTDGALLNRGTINGGFALLVRDGRLTFHYNSFHQHNRVAAPEPLPPGRRRVGVRLDPVGDGTGRVTLSVDGTDVADGHVGPLVRMMSSLGMDVGRATAPVADDFEAPFDYPGRIRELVFEMVPATARSATTARDDAALAARVEQGLQ